MFSVLLKLKNKLIIAYCFEYSKGKICLDTMVTAYPAQTHNTESTGQPAACLMIRLTWCHSLFWNQMPLKWYSIGAAPQTHALPPLGVGSRTAPQSKGFLSTRTHSSAWTPICQYQSGSTGLPLWVIPPFHQLGYSETKHKQQHYLKQCLSYKDSAWYFTFLIHILSTLELGLRRNIKKKTCQFFVTYILELNGFWLKFKSINRKWICLTNVGINYFIWLMCQIKKKSEYIMVLDSFSNKSSNLRMSLWTLGN